jgi:hypothetical protein
MSNPFGPQNDSGSYVDLRKRVFQSVQSANINDQIIETFNKALAEHNVVLSRPERKRLFLQILKLVAEDLTSKLDAGVMDV